MLLLPKDVKFCHLLNLPGCVEYCSIHILTCKIFPNHSKRFTSALNKWLKSKKLKHSLRIVVGPQPALTLERATVKYPSFPSSFLPQVCFIYYYNFCYLMIPLYTAYTPLYANTQELGQSSSCVFSSVYSFHTHWKAKNSSV